MRQFSMITFLVLTAISCQGQEEVHINGHAHNDYEHDRPLMQALENGFISVEADVHVIDGKLYVSHDEPKDLDSTPTLDLLYLNPLMERVKKNDGEVYKGFDDFFYLMIDVKTPAEFSYPVLREMLSQYTDIISVVNGGVDQPNKPIKVFISGHQGRPVSQLMNDDIKYAGLDGRPNELGQGFSVALMPVISQNYSQYLSWNGEGRPNPKELFRLNELIQTAHNEGKKVRLWAAPDNPETWRFLLSIGVDLINTDKLAELRGFLSEREER